MKVLSKTILSTVVIAGMLVSSSRAMTSGSMGEKDQPAYLDTSLTFRQRAADLVSRMTLEEKVSQMMNSAGAIPRLGIPAYNWWSEALHGVARNGIATVFPQAIGMAATWNTRLIHAEADVISTEARAKYNYAISKGQHRMYAGLSFWSPNINIFRDPRWGRGQETYGEDPFLTSQMAVAFITGMQGDNPKYFKVIATPKHFDAYSGPEPMRHEFSANPDRADLFETYLPAFKAAITEGKAYSIMAAYNSLNGVPCSANSFLLTDLLRGQWGFQGYVVSDCGAIWDIYYGHKYAPSIMAASADAVKAGCDLTCGNEYATLPEAVKEGLISEAAIDSAVTHLMLARFRLGLFDPRGAVPYDTITIADNNTPAHMELARKVADESIVLLKNAQGILPLRKDLKSVAVVGLYADDNEVLLGNYHGTPSNPVTILQGIRNKLGSGVDVRFAPGYNLPEDRIINIEPIQKQYLSPANGSEGHGLYAEYFDNPDLKGKPVLTRVDGQMRNYWGFVSPGEGVPAGNFSLRWTGSVTPPTSGNYIIGIATSYKARLYLNGRLIVNEWNHAKFRVLKSKTVHLEQGKSYPIKVEFANKGNNAFAALEWFTKMPEPSGAKLVRDAIQTAKKSDVVIAVAGISPRLESEENDNINIPGFKGGDRTRLRIPENEEAVLKALKKTGKPIVLVLVGGSALAVNWEEANLPAIIDAWYPGEEGGNAVADVLFGDYNPAGRLPVTFYKSVSQLPPFPDYSMKGRTYRYFTGTPLYPFGFGLSYTSFKYSGMSVNKEKANAGDTVVVSVDVENTGSRDGDEVVQLYAKNLDPKGYHAVESLKGFDRVTIRKGETKKIDINLPVESLARYSAAKKGLAVEPGKYELMIGSSSKDIKFRKTITVE